MMDRVECPPDHTVCRVRSGDVRLFCRVFGSSGRTPLLIMHGANYYDSYDWIGVAQKLTRHRMVVAFDLRGFGESDWSPALNYSVDTMIADVCEVIRHFGWPRVILMGHSASGRLAISVAAAHRDLVERLIVVDSSFAKKTAKGGAAGGQAPRGVVFASVEAAMRSFAKASNAPRFAVDRARAERALSPVEGGWRIKRDPFYRNAVPLDGDKSVRPLRELDVWEELPRIECPIQFVRGVRSNRFLDETVARIMSIQPQARWAHVDAEHDIAFQAPDELVAAVAEFMEPA